MNKKFEEFFYKAQNCNNILKLLDYMHEQEDDLPQEKQKEIMEYIKKAEIFTEEQMLFVQIIELQAVLHSMSK